MGRHWILFLPSDIIAAYLYAQLENLNEIQAKRKILYKTYRNCLSVHAANFNIKLPSIPEYSTNNAHIFYLILESQELRQSLINYLKDHGIMAVSHYISLHSSKYYGKFQGDKILPNSDYFTQRLLRLPLYYELDPIEVEEICSHITDFLDKY